MKIQIPYKWEPRDYQLPAWRSWDGGCKHLELIWHRRSGKDDVCLNISAKAALKRQATYWHMLPEAAQARKAIWEAINPHTGIRRIDEAFPREIRTATREQEMMIKFVNGSTWQVVGSDNYNSLVGAPPAGVVYSEWALAKPSARAYLRPILAENGGWQIFITTPRGKNHAHKTYKAAKSNPDAFAQKLTAYQTGVFSPEQLESERLSYIDDFGEDYGEASFQQEYLCSFDAAILGTFYTKEIAILEQEGRLVEFDIEDRAVDVAMDIGKTDDTSIWFYQRGFKGPDVIDFHTSNGHDMDFYINLLRGKDYKIGTLFLPHDARQKRLGMPRTVEQQFRDAGFIVRVIPNHSIQDGIQAARKTLQVCRIHERCEDGVEALRMYRREWDADNKVFRNKPVHDWASNPADGFRYMAMSWRDHKAEKPPEPGKTLNTMTLNDLWNTKPQKQRI